MSDIDTDLITKEITKEFIDDIFVNIHNFLLQKIATRFDTQIFSYITADAIELSQDIHSGHIIALGPYITEAWRTYDHLTFNIGADEAGQIKTKTYNKIGSFDLTYDLVYLAENLYDLLRIQKQYIDFLKESEQLYFEPVEHTFRLKKISDLSPENIRNFSETITARGSFVVERVFTLNDNMSFESKRIYNFNPTTHTKGVLE